MDMFISISRRQSISTSFCFFFGLIKLIRFCRFNRRRLLFINTIRHAAKDLLSFSVMFSIVFVLFLSLFYLLFTSKLSACSSLLQTAYMLLEMTVMKFNVYELMDASPFLGPFSFSLLIFLVIFVCLSIVITIINDSFRFVRDHPPSHLNADEQIFPFIFQRFRRWLCRRSESQIMEERDEEMRSQYYDPIEHFSDRIDQLLDALNRIYMDQQSALLRSMLKVPPNVVNCRDEK